MSKEMAILIRHAHGRRKTTFWMLNCARAWVYDNTLLLRMVQ